MLEQILQIVQEAGDIARKYCGKINDTQVVFKGETDIVTIADQEIENLLKHKLAKLDKTIDFLGEEGDYGKPDDYERVFICDPLDGTTSYRHGFPTHAVSIGLRENGSTTLGVVHLPYLNETFYAIKGKGAFKDKKQIHVSATQKLVHSLCGTGLGCVRAAIKPDNVPVIANAFYKTQGVRISGSAACDLCFVAEGKYDAYWEFLLKPWDYEAGRLIAREAGATVTDFNGGEVDDNVGQVIASNGILHKQIQQLILDTIG